MGSLLRQELSRDQMATGATSQGTRFKDTNEVQAASDASRSGATHKSCLEQPQQSTHTIRTQVELELLKKEIELLQRQNEPQNESLKALSSKDFPLDSDVTGYLLNFLPDLPSLISASLTCRFLYGVFEAGRQSITHAVAFNQIGPALPQALRLARSEVAVLLRAEARDLPREDSALSTNISRQEAVVLARNAEVATEFENLFSWKRKDRRSTTSVLTEEESFRFQRAIYRIMLLCFAYGMGSIPESQYLGGCQSKQQDFLEEIPSPELYEIQKVAVFIRHVGFIRLLEDVNVIGLLEVYELEGLVLFAGPHLLLQCYKYRNSFDIALRYLDDDRPYKGFLMSPLKQVLSGRGDSTRPPDSPRTILDSIHGEDERCSKCNTEDAIYSGVNLVNATCWGDLKGALHKDLQMWTRKLLRNPMENKFLEAIRNVDYRAFMDTLCDATRGEYSKGEWICRGCLSSLWQDALPAWWLQQRLEEGIQIKEDCWDGHMCGKQSKSDLEHTQQFNHVCNPRFNYQS